MTLEEEILSANILIVDDLEANVLLLSRMLAEEGYTRVSATMEPAEACSLHRKHDYDLILLDLQMPGMDGFAVMEGLRAHRPAGWLPVIVITAQPGHKHRALAAGARDFISRPFDVVEVKTRVHNMLEVQVLHRQLETHNKRLEQAVADRTAELRKSEARFRNLVELASDWYWEQDERGAFTVMSGPVSEMLGILDPSQDASSCGAVGQGWVEEERQTLRAKIAARQPFLDLAVHRVGADGSTLQFRVSGQPVFNQECRFVGYRGVGAQVIPKDPPIAAASQAIQ
jgi:CheY-like chemotaxis protein